MRNITYMMVLFIGSLLIADDFYKYTNYDPVSEEAKVNYADFLNPKQESRIASWWHWMGSKITKDGIEKDLEAFRKNNYGELTIFGIVGHHGNNFGDEEKEVYFNSPKWYEMVKHTFEKASKLDLKIGFHNCPGWSEAGGPWISPEQSMQTLTWSIQTLKGDGKNHKLSLEKPSCKRDYYKDIAVVVWKTKRAPSLKMHENLENISSTNTAAKTPTQSQMSDMLNKGLRSSLLDFRSDLEKTDPNYLEFKNNKGAFPAGFILKFKEPFTASSLYFGTIFKHEFPAELYLEVSDNGKDFRKIKKLELNTSDNLVQFEKTTAQYWRVARYHSKNPSHLALMGAVDESSLFATGFELLQDGEISRFFSPIPDLIVKSAQGFNTNLTVRYADKDAKIDVVDIDSVRVFKKAVKEDGIFEIDLPNDSSYYAVMRLGCTTTGHQVLPAPKGGEGLEVDKMSAKHVKHHFDSYPQKMIDVAGEYKDSLGTLLTDSWECHVQNWTEGFDEEFLDINDYDFFKFIPVFANETVASVASSERFLNDFRNTTSKLVHKNFYSVMQEKATKNGITYELEPAKDIFLMNHIDTFLIPDIPMDEVWQKPRDPEKTDLLRLDWQRYYPISVAHIIGKRRVSCESGTCNNGEWAHTPWTTKGTLDSILFLGFNRIVLHTGVHQPDDSFPGVQLGTNGLDFNRHMTWWDYSGDYFQYLNRMQYMLTQGGFESEFLYLYADAVPAVPLGWPEFKDNGFSFDLANGTIVQNFLRVKDGRIITPGKMSYKVLQISNNEHARYKLETLEKIKELVEEGSVVSGFKPTYDNLSNIGGEKSQARWVEICNELFGDGTKKEITLGKGKILVGYNTQEIVDALKMIPQVTFPNGDAQKFVWIERSHKEQNVRWFLLRNDTFDEQNTVISFKAHESAVQIWNPETGEKIDASIYSQNNGRTDVALAFKPAQSLIVMFDSKSSPQRAVEVLENGRQIFPSSGASLDNTKISENWVMYFECNTDFNDETQRNFIITPERMHLRMNDNLQSCASLDIGKNYIFIFEHGANMFKKVLEYKGDVPKNSKIALVYNDNAPSIFLNGKIVAKGEKSSRIVHPATGNISGFKGKIQCFNVVAKNLSAEKIDELFIDTSSQIKTISNRIVSKDGKLFAEFFSDAKIDCVLADGKKVSAISSKENIFTQKVEGPFEVFFDEKLGGPEKATFKKLSDWTENSDSKIKHYSGKAVYKKNVKIPSLVKEQKIYLEIDEFYDVAELSINGKKVAQVWSLPFFIDITDFIKEGDNLLEIGVANTWVNRCLYDATLPKEERITASPTMQFHYPDSPEVKTPRPWKYGALKSGLIGDMKIISSQIVELK